mgnify:CR=1 FL=1
MGVYVGDTKVKAISVDSNGVEYKLKVEEQNGN